MTQQTRSPVDGRIYVERPYADEKTIAQTLVNARKTQLAWKNTPLEMREMILTRFVDLMLQDSAVVAEEITWQMGRPISQTPGELKGMAERAHYMIAQAKETLAPIRDRSHAHPNIETYIQRVPVGVVFVIAPWNYPYLTAINTLIPALMAGNTVIMKHSSQTPLCAERFAYYLAIAGLPEGVFQYLHLQHRDTQNIIESGGVDYVAFTGSVEGGIRIQNSAAKQFIGVGLELGGKDPAYVRHDADIPFAAENLVDGAFYNSGQSCCGIERIYVHDTVYDAFVEATLEHVKQYRLGDPTNPNTNLGPVVKPQAAQHVLRQIDEAIHKGAQALIDTKLFQAHNPASGYLAPQVLIDVDHGMSVMKEESFGPVVGIMRVSDDDEAQHLMNDSDFGLTASIWTSDEQAAIDIGQHIETGTWFMNRCDYLDPALAWVGVKQSGRGCSLSRLGYEHVTRPKSFHLRRSIA